MKSSSQIREKFIKVRNQSINLCNRLSTEDYVVQPVVDVSPPKWHLAHTTWFFENLLLLPFKKDYKVFHPDYAYFFNSYYESLGDRVIRPNRGNMTRPTVEEVYSFRKYVDQQMLAFFEEHDQLSQEQWDIIEIGINHEQQHQELLVTDIKYILGHNPLFPAYHQKENVEATIIDKANYSEVKEGVYDIGYQGHGFHYDNELGVHKVYIHPFRFSDRLVTNQEYQEFIKDGGYKKFNFWLSEGWEWVKENQKNAPLYWHKVNDTWHQYTLHGLQKLNPAEPVTHVSFYEADAFAAWKGQRLLTEFEWEVAVKQYYQEDQIRGNFVDQAIIHPQPHQSGSFQFFGDAWEWTASAYRPYPHYKKPEGAIGEYNGKFMINQMVLRGGSCATPQDHIRPTYRNFFHPHLQWQFTGIRLAQDI
ncbi:MAG: ergothioneine biosynthesis protein EgtB [Candidatus Cyclobacteriaceae bacterium M3_2C_046]